MKDEIVVDGVTYVRKGCKDAKGFDVDALCLDKHSDGSVLLKCVDDDSVFGWTLLQITRNGDFVRIGGICNPRFKLDGDRIKVT